MELNKNGIFTVKSAYKVHYEYKRRNRVRAVGAATSSGTRDDRFWKELWKITRPRKMVHFMWRFSHNSLALHVNLKRRGMKLDTRCVLCGRYDEDGSHLFFKCKYVKKVWAELNLDQIRQSLVNAQPAREVVEIILKLKEDVQCQVIILLYFWWSERCGVRE